MQILTCTGTECGKNLARVSEKGEVYSLDNEPYAALERNGSLKRRKNNAASPLFNISDARTMRCPYCGHDNLIQ
jgi:hypothetical protein